MEFNRRVYAGSDTSLWFSFRDALLGDGQWTAVGDDANAVCALSNSKVYAAICTRTHFIVG